jgi:DNA-binding NarL/FixJ family response regulator
MEGAVGLSTELASGHEALARGDWEAARDSFERSLAEIETPEALDGLGRALWWLRDPAGAVVHRERAYSGFRRDGELARAARVALWLSREYALVWRNDAAANGWLARAQRLLANGPPGADTGWLALARSERAPAPAEAAELAATALRLGVESGDVDLELRALAQLGLAEVSVGLVDDGLARLDEAMAAVTAGEAPSLETFADVSCTLMLACERAGDTERTRQWSEVFETFARSYDHMPLLAFCRTCCADVHAASGRVDAAEEELEAALHELAEAGQRSRCIQPAVRLAEIRVAQGRFQEADQLLVGFELEPDAADVAVQLRIAQGEPEAAIASLERRLGELDETSLLAAPLHARLVEASVAAGDVPRATRASERLEHIAGVAGRDRVVAMSLDARGQVAAATGDREAAAPLLRDAVNAFARLGLRLDAARARLRLGRALLASAPAEAADVVRGAHAELESLGAAREASQAAAILRTLGLKAAAGPRAAGELTRRETEVLRLLGEGLTNRQIAERLFLSPKTVEHHVARIYRKLGLGTRAEAAAWAVRHLGGD